MTVRVGIIGAGQAGERHALGFAECEEASVVAICDQLEDRASALADRIGAVSCSKWSDLLAMGLDAVVVALPHNLHVEPVVTAAERGVHVLLEKPIATTVADARHILDSCKRYGVHLCMSFVHRYRAELEATKHWIEDGQIGVPLLAFEHFASQNASSMPSWVLTKSSAGGGVLMYGAIHSVDRLRWLFNAEVTRVTAATRTFSADSEVEDGVVALLHFTSGAVASLAACAPLYRANPTRWETEVYGTTGAVRVRTRDRAELASDDHSETVAAPQVISELGQNYNFARQADAFAKSIQAGDEPAVTGWDGLAALRVALGIYESAETGETVNLDQNQS